MTSRSRKASSAVVGLAVWVIAGGAAFAKDSRTVKLPYPAVISGRQVQAGSYRLDWQAHSPQLTLTFVKDHGVVATAQGHWEDRDVRYERHTVVYQMRPGGDNRIIEIRLAGMRKALVIDAPDSN